MSNCKRKETGKKYFKMTHLEEVLRDISLIFILESNLEVFFFLIKCNSIGY